jgi:zinc transport system permease protein
MPHSSPHWSELVAGWELGIYQAPIYCGLLAGLLLGYLGVFVVLRRSVFVTATVSQAAGLGVALAFFLQIHVGVAVPPVLGAVVVALGFTAVFALPLERLPLSRESLLGVAYLIAWAASIIVGERISQEAHDIASILFGTAVLVRSEDLIALAAIGGAALLFHAWAHRGITFVLFDPEGARVQGLPVRALDLTSWLWVALVVSVATRALGVLPVFAFAVLPALSGMLLFSRLRWVLLVAAVLGAIGGGGGYIVAFFSDLPVGACQAAVAASGLALAAVARAARPAS